MATGLRVPVGVSNAGRAGVEEDPDQLYKILRLELSAGEDDNPFQNIGIDEGLIFQVNDPTAQGLARVFVERILAKYRDRIRLDASGPISIRQDTEGELHLSFRYVDLETGSARDFNEVIG